MPAAGAGAELSQHAAQGDFLLALPLRDAFCAELPSSSPPTTHPVMGRASRFSLPAWRKGRQRAVLADDAETQATLERLFSFDG